MTTNGNTILITGGTSGIGLGLAKQFLKDGNKVIICSRRGHTLEKIKRELPAIVTRVCDVSQQKDREALCAWVVAEHPTINVLVNNAGIQLALDLTQPADLNDVREEMEINFFAPLHLSSLLAQHLQSMPNPAIINISSGLAFVPIAYMPVYCASKAALHSLSLSMRHQLRNTSIKVFEVIPPSVDTELGHQNRRDKTQTHGGISIDEFVEETMKELRNGTLEAPIGAAKGLHMKRETVFDTLNRH